MISNQRSSASSSLSFGVTNHLRNISLIFDFWKWSVTTFSPPQDSTITFGRPQTFWIPRPQNPNLSRFVPNPLRSICSGHGFQTWSAWPKRTLGRSFTLVAIISHLTLGRTRRNKSSVRNVLTYIQLSPLVEVRISCKVKWCERDCKLRVIASSDELLVGVWSLVAILQWHMHACYGITCVIRV